MSNLPESSNLAFKNAFMSLSENEFKLFLNEQNYSLDTLIKHLTQTNGFPFYDEESFKAQESKQKILMDLIEQMTSLHPPNQVISQSNRP